MIPNGTPPTLTGKRILISGAGRGIGKRLALGFAAAGARLGLLARSKPELDLVAMEISQSGGDVLRLRADVRDAQQVYSAFELMSSHFGGVDAVVCAAAIQGPIGPLAETSLEEWNDTIQTNLLGAVHLCHAALPSMTARRAGKILALVGGGAAVARPYFTAYAASKTALVRLVESLAEEVRDHNIQVNCMSPGGAYTHMTDQILQAGERAGWKEIERAETVRLTGGVPVDKQVALAVFLLSECSNHISGRFLHVNDDWRRLEHSNIQPEVFTLRRLQRV